MNLQWQIGRGAIALVLCGVMGGTVLLSAAHASHATSAIANIRAAEVSHKNPRAGLDRIVARQSRLVVRKQDCALREAAPLTLGLLDL